MVLFIKPGRYTRGTRVVQSTGLHAGTLSWQLSQDPAKAHASALRT